MSGSLMSGGGVEASIPLQAGKFPQPAPVNPLQTIGQFATIQNALNQNKLFPGQMQLQGQAIQSGQTTLAQHLQQVGSNAMAPFLAIENPTMKDLTNAAGYAEGIAGGTTQHIMQVAQNNPFPVDTPEWGGWMKRSVAALAQTDPATAVAQAAGTPVDISNGGTLFAGVRAPVTAGGGVTATTGTRLGLTPGEQNDMVTYTDASGVTHTALKGGAATSLGGNQPGSPPMPLGTPFGNPGGRWGPGTATQPGNPALRNVPLPNPGANPAGPQPGPMPGSLNPPAPPNFAGPAPGALTAPVEGAKMYANDLAADQTYPTQKLNLDTALNALKNTKTGPGTEATQHILSFIQAQAPGLVPKQTTDSVTNYDLAVKALAAVARGMPGAQNSDMAQSLAQTASASTHISNSAAQHVVQQMQGLLEMNHAGVSQFTKEQGPQNAGQYSTWLNQSFTPGHHPMGFVFNALPAAEQQSLLKQYGGDRATLQRIINSRNAAQGAAPVPPLPAAAQ